MKKNYKLTMTSCFGAYLVQSMVINFIPLLFITFHESFGIPLQQITLLVTVNFITHDELKRNHSGIPHGGFVIRTGVTGKDGEHKHTIEYSLKLDSNPEFTSSVLVAYARAIDRMAKRGMSGCKTVFDVAPADLSQMSAEELRAHLL